MMACAQVLQRPLALLRQRLAQEMAGQHRHQLAVLRRVILHWRNTTLTLPMPKGRGFLVRRPLRRLRGIGVLHDLPKREFPCAPRYVLFPFMQLWICLPKPCAGCSLRHSHLCRDGFRTLGNPIRGRSNPLSVDSDSRRRSKSDSTGRRYRL